MEVKIIHSVSEVFKFLKDKTRYDYIYQFNDLSPKEWDNVICYGLFDNLLLKEIDMLLINYDIPVLLAASFANEKYNTELLSRIKNFLPSKFYTHIDRETLDNVFHTKDILEQEEYMNMGLCNYDLLDKKGYGEKVVCSLVKDIKNKIKFIGLNVKVENLAAINCYKNLDLWSLENLLVVT